MERIKSFFKGAKEMAVFILLLLGALLAFCILLIVASIEEAVVWIAKLFGKQISFAPIFPDEQEYDYDYP
jgi:uncharacterized membrane protein YqiK